jgi:hypothetical protein
MCHCDVEQFPRREHLAEAAGGRVLLQRLVRQIGLEDGGKDFWQGCDNGGGFKKGAIHSLLCESEW